MSTPLPRHLSATAVVAAFGMAVLAGQQPRTGLYSAQQAQTGRAAYERSCSVCHLPTLEGSFEAPPLAGGNFMNTWRSRTISDLFTVMKTSMPPGTEGSLGDEAYLSIIAYILSANGVPAGPQPLGSPVTVAIGAAGQGSAPATTAAGAEPQGRGGRGGGGGDGDGARAPSMRGSRGVTVAGEVKNFRPITDAMLKAPPPGDWLMIRGNPQGWSYSPLSEITPANVKNLRPVWQWAMADGSNQASPLVHDGTIYLVNPGNIVQALDGATGDLIWEYRAGPDQGGPMRNLAASQDKIFVATTDARLVALEARTGRRVWETQIADRAKGFSNSSGPMVANGKVIEGLGGCTRYDDEGCFISAYDAATGKLAWKVDTIPRPGQVGDDSWGKMPYNLRAGGETWITGSYDPDLHLTYWGVAQAKPWVPASRGMTVFDKALYTNSTLAINVDDGKIAWYHQLIPGEAMDMDEVFERVLVDVDDRKTVFSVGKTGILWKLDRKTGDFLGFKETVYQNIFSRIDPKTGAVSYRADIAEAQIGEWVQGCPSTSGGHNWQAMSYHQPSGLLIIPLAQSCFEIAGRKMEFKDGSGGNAGDRRWFEMPGVEGRAAKLGAFDIKTMREVWNVQQRALYLTSALSTAGGVVFVGDVDRNFHAYDARTGKALWQTRLGTSLQGFPVSFSIGGKQYVAVTTGIGGGSPRRIPSLLTREIHYPEGGNALSVFALPDRDN